LVFLPKYSRGVFDTRSLKILKEIFESVCADFEATLLEFNGEDDHVHLLVSYPPKVAVSHLVNSLKGVSSRLLRQARPDISDRYWNGGLWSASYFASSVGEAPISALRKYIDQERAPA
jgi:putative transposase